MRREHDDRMQTGVGPFQDLADPDTFMNGPPFGLFRTMRREAPVCWNTMQDGSGFWSLTCAAEIVEVSRDPERFSAWRGGTMIRDDAVVPLDVWRRAMINMDPPEHTKFRELVNRAFSARRIAELEPAIRATLRVILDEVADLREFNLVDKIAVPLPLIVIADLLGVPRSDHALLVDWNARIAGFDDASLRKTPDDGLRALMEMVAYLCQLISEPSGRPERGLVDDLLTAEIEGQRLSVPEIAGLFSLLLVAGNETTRNTYSGGMHALLEHPEQLQLIAQEPQRIPDAVEEMLRWVSAVMHFRRTATQRTELAGVPIEPGDRLVMWYASANRDEAIFERPEVFDVRRARNRHQAFGGGGRHFCLGAPMARLELRILLEETLERFPNLRLGGPPRRMRSALFNALSELPVATR
jgi:cholest-4-en-3-one 26-monooxygenase